MRTFEIHNIHGIFRFEQNREVFGDICNIPFCDYKRVDKSFNVIINKSNLINIVKMIEKHNFDVIGDLSTIEKELSNKPKTRDELQQEVVDLSFDLNNLFIEWVTGFGKTLAAIKIINNHKGRWLFVYKETTHLKNHLEDVEKHGMSHLLPFIDWTTYNSIHKYADNEYTGVVLDECHASTSDIRQEKLSKFKGCKIIATSATIDGTVKNVLSSIFGSFHTHKVTFDDAVKWKILPKPKIYLIPLVLDSENISETISIKKGKNPKNKVETTYSDRWKHMKLTNTEIIINCTQQEKYDYLTDNLNYWMKKYREKAETYIKNKFLQYGTQRKRYLASIKTDTAKKILEIIKDKKFICFAGSVPQAKELGGLNAVHSANKKNDEIIQSFNNGDIQSIYAVNMLKEGVNLSNIEASLIIQLSSKELDIVQRTGRILRAKEQPTQYIIYYRNTQDEKYLENVLKLFDSETLVL